MAERGPDLVDPRLIKAVEHPLRMEILAILMNEASSPARIERRLENVSLNLIAHHMKVLKETGCIELVETVTRRGAKERIYRASRSFVFSDDAWERMPAEARWANTAAILRVLSADLANSLATGKFEERPDRHLSRTPMKLDEQGWAEVRDALERTFDEVTEIREKAAQRLEQNGEPGFPASVAIISFPRSEPES